LFFASLSLSLVIGHWSLVVAWLQGMVGLGEWGNGGMGCWGDEVMENDIV
jgi:hypothetical protein